MTFYFLHQIMLKNTLKKVSTYIMSLFIYIYIYRKIRNLFHLWNCHINICLNFSYSYRLIHFFRILKEIINMMILSNFIFLPLSIVVLIMVTCTATTKVPQSIEEGSQSYNADEVCIIIFKNSYHSILCFLILATFNSCSYGSSSNC